MNERGMIFNDEMVRALLDGLKTQTRRIVNWRGLSEGLNLNFSGLKVCEYPKGWVIESDSRSSCEWRSQPTPCPYGADGDRIWVRETFSCIGNEDGHPVDTDGNLCSREDAQRIYRASAIKKSNNYGLWTSPDGFDFEGAWTPSIHMPRWASRVLLEITAVRIERLNDISEKDAQAEGVTQLQEGFWKHYQPGWTQHQLSARGSFATLWDSIYGEGAWDRNPWVWVVEFKRIGEEAL
jgi:hypothetical protein